MLLDLGPSTYNKKQTKMRWNSVFRKALVYSNICNDATPCLIVCFMTEHTITW